MASQLPVWVIDAILVFVVVEAAVLTRRGRLVSSPVARRGLLANLASGGALLLALRSALAGAVWPITAACLLAALFAHFVDIGSRRGPR
jgi:hypothetical protein